MLLAISASGVDLEAPFEQRFGRCAHFVLVESATGEFSSVVNPGQSSVGGAGIEAARKVVALDAKAVVTGAVGPNALDVLRAARVDAFAVSATTVRQAWEAYVRGDSTRIDQPNSPGKRQGRSA